MQEGDGYLYRGRGYCQLTWKNNYHKLGDALGVDLVADPELASDPELATRIILLGMRDGLFTGKDLSDYLGPEAPESSNTEPDYFNARRIINGVDKADVIARYARAFQKILQEMD